MPAHIAQRANDRLRFAGDVPVSARLAACKEFLRAEMVGLRARHKAGGSGVIICQERAQIIDAMLSHLFDYALTTFTRTRGPLPVVTIRSVASTRNAVLHFVD